MKPAQSPSSALAPDSRRSLILCAIGAVAGLGLAGMGLFTAQGTRTSHVPPEDIALVNGVPILVSDYETQVRDLYGVSLSQTSRQQRKGVLASMIREEIYVQRGVELGMQNDVIEVRSALVAAVEGQQTVNAIAAPVDSSELLAFYKAHPDKYSSEGTIDLDDYVAPDASKAQAATTALRAGQPSQAIIAMGLKPGSRMTDGSEYYFAAEAHLGKPLFTVARDLKDGQVSDPVQAEDGWHVLVMRRNSPPVERPYDTLKDKVLQDVREDKAARLHTAAEGFLRKRADILYAKGAE
ncbi:peptidylprolyl isomerase [Asticcacaulis sp.]|uniref:peptidylprolyl isomerase n=1 Tax=Asticcacaulis sp. TaxID=1872648 RepID=UPI002BBE8846|nr:peptidylprolyl isomerase [Asticcacaulis sp.]HTM81603.1 peptidylprolyl isomerase [Asticcacaulis sp.]